MKDDRFPDEEVMKYAYESHLYLMVIVQDNAFNVCKLGVKNLMFTKCTTHMVYFITSSGTYITCL